jgi:hypothetical protein
LAPENECFPEESRNLFYGNRTNAYRIIITIRGGTVHVLPGRRGAHFRLARLDKFAFEDGRVSDAKPLSRRACGAGRLALS